MQAAIAIACALGASWSGSVRDVAGSLDFSVTVLETATLTVEEETTASATIHRATIEHAGRAEVYEFTTRRA